MADADATANLDANGYGALNAELRATAIGLRGFTQELVPTIAEEHVQAVYAECQAIEDMTGLLLSLVSNYGEGQNTRLKLYVRDLLETQFDYLEVLLRIMGFHFAYIEPNLYATGIMFDNSPRDLDTWITNIVNNQPGLPDVSTRGNLLEPLRTMFDRDMQEIEDVRAVLLEMVGGYHGAHHRHIKLVALDIFDECAARARAYVEAGVMAPQL